MLTGLEIKKIIDGLNEFITSNRLRWTTSESLYKITIEVENWEYVKNYIQNYWSKNLHDWQNQSFTAAEINLILKTRKYEIPAL